MRHAFRTFLLALIAASSIGAQGTLADYRRADSISSRIGSLIVGTPTGPEWLGNSNRAWYRRSVTGGNEWMLVDAAAATKAPLFDHARLATAVSSVTGAAFTPITLPFAAPTANFNVANDAASITFNRDGSA